MRRYMILGTIVGCFVVGCESSPATRVERPPLVEPEPEETVDLGPVRSTLAEFLEARWSLREAEALEYVTEADREHVWPLTFEPYLRKLVPDGVAIERWYEWRILDLQVRDGAAVDARVEVVMPTIGGVALWGLHANMALMRLMSSGGDTQTRMKRMSTVRNVLIPPRRVVVMDYRLVRTGGDWRVLMGWEHYPPSDRGSRQGDAPVVDLDFEGSEKWWLREREKNAESNAALTAPQRQLLEKVEDAERMVRRKQFDEALKLYESILVDAHAPEFLADRPAKIGEQKRWWESKLEAANVVFSASAQSGDDGRLVFDVTVKNRGSHALRAVRAVLEFAQDTPARAGTCRFHDLAAGSEQTTTVRAYAKDDAVVPSVKRVRVVDLRFGAREMEQTFTQPDDSAFEHELDDFQSGGVAATRLHRILETVEADAERLDACPDWPAEPIDVRLDVDADGDVTGAGVRTEGVSGVFASCVEDALNALTFAEPDDGWAVVLQLVPPDFWKE